MLPRFFLLRRRAMRELWRRYASLFMMLLMPASRRHTIDAAAIYAPYLRCQSHASRPAALLECYIAIHARAQERQILLRLLCRALQQRRSLFLSGTNIYILCAAMPATIDADEASLLFRLMPCLPLVAFVAYADDSSDIHTCLLLLICHVAFSS